MGEQRDRHTHSMSQGLSGELETGQSGRDSLRRNGERSLKTGEQFEGPARIR